MTLDSLLSTREVGRRLAEGPWQRLGSSRWGVPVVAYLSRVAAPDLIVDETASGFEAAGRVAPAVENIDPVGARR